METVIPMAFESFCLKTHERRCAALGCERLFYALLDADGAVILYELRKPQLWAPIGQRGLDERFVEPEA